MAKSGWVMSNQPWANVDQEIASMVKTTEQQAMDDLKAEQVEKFLMNHDENGRKVCAHEEADPHSCPYRVDIDNDPDTMCRCCQLCEHDCQMDV